MDETSVPAGIAEATEAVKVTVDTKIVTYDRMFKEFLYAFSDALVVEMINSIFRRDFDPATAKVVKLDKESVINVEQRIKDTYFAVLDRDDFNAIQINNDYFNFEAQTGNDDEMALRVFEYAFTGARVHGESKPVLVGGTLKNELRLPRSAVLYLRSDHNTPTLPNMTLIVTDTDGKDKRLSYNIPTVRIGDFTARELSNKHLYAMLPFYPLKFSYEIRRAHSEQVELTFKESFAELSQVVTEMTKRGLISEPLSISVCDSAWSLGMRMIENNAYIIDTKGVKEAVENVKETVTFYDYQGTLNRMVREVAITKQAAAKQAAITKQAAAKQVAIAKQQAAAEIQRMKTLLAEKEQEISQMRAKVLSEPSATPAKPTKPKHGGTCR